MKLMKYINFIEYTDILNGKKYLKSNIIFFMTIYKWLFLYHKVQQRNDFGLKLHNKCLRLVWQLEFLVNIYQFPLLG